MELLFDKNKLLEAINIVIKAVPVRSTKEILECILIDASGDQITLTGNDTELGIETVVEGRITAPGSIALDAKTFSSIIHKFPDEPVHIVTNDNLQAQLTCGKAKYNIPGKDPLDYSPLPAIDREEHITLSQFSLKNMIRQTIFSIAVNENNKMMTGELMEIIDNNLRLVGLDGHRISLRNVQLREPFADRKVVIPGKTLSEVSKILTGGMEDTVNIYFSDNHLLFEFDDTMVVTSLLNGEFFEIDQMISTDYSTKVVVNNHNFQDVIDRSSLLVRDSDKVPALLEIEDTGIHLFIDSQMGSMNESIAIEKAGRDLRIAFNPKFLLDALRVIDEEEVNIYFMNPHAPCFIRDDAGSYLYLILPVNIQG